MSVMVPEQKSMRRGPWRAVAAASGLAVAAAVLVAAPAGASAASAPKVSPGSGPVGTTITVRGECGTAPSGFTWFKPKLALYFADAFEQMGDAGPSTFFNTVGTVIPSGAYSGTITVPAKANYTLKGSGPAMPGKEIKDKPVSGKILVLVQCYSSLSPYPMTSESTSFTVTSAAKRLTSTAKPAITGTAKVGKKLKASKGAWSPTPTRYHYQWFRGTKALPGAKAHKAQYKVVAADKGKKIRVQVTADRAGFSSATAKSKPVKIKK